MAPRALKKWLIHFTFLRIHLDILTELYRFKSNVISLYNFFVLWEIKGIRSGKPTGMWLKIFNN